MTFPSFIIMTFLSVPGNKSKGLIVRKGMGILLYILYTLSEVSLGKPINVRFLLAWTGRKKRFWVSCKRCCKYKFNGIPSKGVFKLFGILTT